MLLRRQTTTGIERPADTAERDCRTVAVAASLLGLEEFEFFRLAYRRWFGRLPHEQELEKAYTAYMFRQVVPPWARQLSREVLDRQREGTLGLEDLGASRFRDRPSRHPKGPLYFTAVVAIWIALFSVILNTRYDPGTSAPVPTCAGESGSYFFETWVKLISGKPLPTCEAAARRR